MQLEGKVAIVTGGGSGTGRAISLAFGREGADVVVAAESEKPLKEVASKMEEMGRENLPVLMDLSYPDQPAIMVDKALDKFNKIDILVNNSGIEGPILDVAEMDLDGWNRLLAVNLTGTMLCSRHVLEKSMVPHRSGAIINLASAAGRKGLPRRSAYSSSKFAVIGFTQSLAAEVGRYGIRVNSIAPGAVEGERIDRVHNALSKHLGISYEEVIEMSNARAALGRMVKPEEVAALALFLASENSSGITGQTINCDAGTHMR